MKANGCSTRSISTRTKSSAPRNVGMKVWFSPANVTTAFASGRLIHRHRSEGFVVLDRSSVRGHDYTHPAMKAAITYWPQNGIGIEHVPSSFLRHKGKVVRLPRLPNPITFLRPICDRRIHRRMSVIVSPDVIPLIYPSYIISLPDLCPVYETARGKSVVTFAR